MYSYPEAEARSCFFSGGWGNALFHAHRPAAAFRALQERFRNFLEEEDRRFLPELEPDRTS
ncbi:MAG TPA: hypothetical protein DDY20_13175 [Desulfobulbaceae bacterium]|nr:hypothetical protein [Desulfobulbaceae bacterium]